MGPMAGSLLAALLYKLIKALEYEPLIQIQSSGRLPGLNPARIRKKHDQALRRALHQTYWACMSRKHCCESTVYGF